MASDGYQNNADLGNGVQTAEIRQSAPHIFCRSFANFLDAATSTGCDLHLTTA